MCKSEKFESENNNKKEFIIDVRKNIDNILELNKTNYEKVEIIINLFRVSKTRHHISIVPDYLFTIFWAFAENPKNGIIFDDEEYQYFYVC